MAVKLRLRRMGKKKMPFYRIVATDSRVARDGKYIEKVGHYNPLMDPPEIVVDDEKAMKWLTRGAIPTDTVRSLLSKKGIMLRYHLMKQGLDDAKIDEEMKKWELVKLEKKKREEALQAQKERELKKQQEETEKAVKAEAEAKAEAEQAEATGQAEEAADSSGTIESSETSEAATPADESDDTPKEAE